MTNLFFYQKEEIEKHKNKLKGVNSRVHILESETKTIKSEFDQSKNVLLRKSENDDNLILALKQEIKKVKIQINKKTDEIVKINPKEHVNKQKILSIENEKVELLAFERKTTALSRID